jgi:uncharacterized membrane protein
VRTVLHLRVIAPTELRKPVIDLLTANPGVTHVVFHREVDFIFQVGPLSFVVALFAGAAGMLSLVSAKSAALVGVFISVTTVPAAGFAVVAATVGDWAVAAQSAAQLAVNLVGIVLAGVLVLWVRQLADHRQQAGAPPV